MINARLQVINYEGIEWEEYLKKHYLIDIFLPVLKEYPENIIRKGVLKYIVSTYSLDSDAVIISLEWKCNKQKIFNKCGLPDSLWEDIGLLKNENVLKSINKWLNFQESDVWVQLCTLRDLRVEMQMSANSKILKSSGEIDYSQKFLNATYANDLQKMIKDLEQQLIQNNPILKEGYKEVYKASRRNTKSVEDFIQ